MAAQKNRSLGANNRKMSISEVDKRRCERLLKKFNERRVVEPSLTQKVLAADCELHGSSVSRMLKGTLAISPQAALKFARRLFCHPGEFHDEFIDFTAAKSYQNVQAMEMFERLSEEDQKNVTNLLKSLSD